MRVLVTNDDGLHAPGLFPLALALHEAGHEVIAIAPEGDRSGSAAAIGNIGDGSYLRYRASPLAGLDIEAIELDGPPALCVFASALGAFGPAPDVIASGVNPGLNTGRVTLHSGTVGAALTGANLGISAVAVSITGREASVVHWDVAADLAVQTVEWLPTEEVPTTINLSVPDRPAAELEAVRYGSLASFGAVTTEILSRSDQRLQLGFRPTEQPVADMTDTALVSRGHPVVTALGGITGWEPAGLAELLASRQGS